MRILILEDDESTRELMVEVLTQENYTVIATSRGKEAVHIAKRRHDIDLFLLDIGLPDLDGWTVARMVRKWHPDTPIYLLTAWTVMKQFNNSRAAAVNGVYAKPFSLDFLLGLCRRHDTPSSATP